MIAMQFRLKHRKGIGIEARWVNGRRVPIEEITTPKVEGNERPASLSTHMCGTLTAYGFNEARARDTRHSNQSLTEQRRP